MYLLSSSLEYSVCSAAAAAIVYTRKKQETRGVIIFIQYCAFNHYKGIIKAANGIIISIWHVITVYLAHQGIYISMLHEKLTFSCLYGDARQVSSFDHKILLWMFNAL